MWSHDFLGLRENDSRGIRASVTDKFLNTFILPSNPTQHNEEQHGVTNKFADETINSEYTTEGRTDECFKQDRPICQS